ncbi:Chromate resistance protein ChrB [Streptomyces sp. NPDC057002]|uniref:Chromate resistance protein ChrB n=1 Tax=Streptomyces sp. NPDC057002 TaxID=3345992 RepID=UPI00362F3C65
MPGRRAGRAGCGSGSGRRGRGRTAPAPRSRKRESAHPNSTENPEFRKSCINVTPATSSGVTAQGSGIRWLVLVIKLPAEPSRHRVAVSRELRKVGALSLGQGIWAVPDVPVFAPGVQACSRARRECRPVRA